MHPLWKIIWKLLNKLKADDEDSTGLLLDLESLNPVDEPAELSLSLDPSTSLRVTFCGVTLEEPVSELRVPPQATSNAATIPIIRNFFKAINNSPAKHA